MEGYFRGTLCEGELVGTVVMYGSVSVDGYIADEDDQPGPLFDWLSGGDVPLDESGAVKVSQTSYDYIRPYWDQIGVTVVGRHVFDLTDGWDGKPPGGIDHVVVFGSGKRYFGSVHAQHLLADPDLVIQGDRVLHLRNRTARIS